MLLFPVRPRATRFAIIPGIHLRHVPAQRSSDLADAAARLNITGKDRLNACATPAPKALLECESSIAGNPGSEWTQGTPHMPANIKLLADRPRRADPSATRCIKLDGDWLYIAFGARPVPPNVNGPASCETGRYCRWLRQATRSYPNHRARDSSPLLLLVKDIRLRAGAGAVPSVGKSGNIPPSMWRLL